MLARAQSQDGMTLPEVVVTIAIGMIVTLATFALVDTTMRQSGDVSARVEAVQGGRSAMDAMTRQLRSAACLRNQDVAGMDQPRSIESASRTAVTFYANLYDPSVRAGAPPPPLGPERRTLSYEDGKLVERVYEADAIDAGGRFHYPADPTSRRDLLTNVDLDDDGTPVFQFFRYDFSLAAPLPTYNMDPGAGTLATSDLEKVAKIRITYKAQPARRRENGRASTVFTNEVFMRTVDPNAKPDELSNPCK